MGFIAKKVMRFAAAPSQQVIGVESKPTMKRTFKFTKSLMKRTLKRNEEMETNDNVEATQSGNEPPAKKRKIYQEMTSKQIKKRQRKELKFKTSESSDTAKIAANVTKNNRALLSFDSDED